MSAKQARFDPCTYAYVHYHVISACNGRRDDDNYYARCKPFLDGLRDAGVIKDDDHKHVRLSISHEVDKTRAPMTIITVTRVDVL